MELVILAGGMGSRFGGLKQLAPVDDESNFILDYSIFDAIKSGFNRVVFIIKEENYQAFRDTVGKRVEKQIETAYAFQNNKNVPKAVNFPSDRTKPLGTAHALLCAKNVVKDNFVVINADDFYGREAYETAAKFLSQELKRNQFAMVGYKIADTLTDKGSVKRGVCSIKNGYLTSIVESEVKKDNGKLVARPLDKKGWELLRGDETASMNIFGFSRDIFPYLQEGFFEFLHKNQKDLSSVEYLLPARVEELIKQGKISVEVLKSDAEWKGITYAEDMAEFKVFIARQKHLGKYPKHLWSQSENE